MCGVIYCQSFDGQPVNEVVAQQFKAQRNRGTEGFGFYDRASGRLSRSTKERKILGKLKNTKSDAILFHHRFPTSTENVRNACHPFSTMRHFDTNYILIHNGWVSNADELRAKHEAMGIEYYSVQPDGRFNDSEALLWDVALYLEGQQDKLYSEGAIAFICMARNEQGDKLFFARNSSPLNMLKNDYVFLLSSEGPGKSIAPHTLYTFDYNTENVEQKPLTIPSYSTQYSYSGTTTSAYNFEVFNYTEEEEEYELDFPVMYREDMTDEEVAKDIKYEYQRYANRAQGKYDDMLIDISFDIDQISREIKSEEKLMGGVPQDLYYWREVLRQVSDLLLCDPDWHDEHSVIPEYQGRALPLGGV